MYHAVQHADSVTLILDRAVGRRALIESQLVYADTEYRLA